MKNDTFKGGDSYVLCQRSGFKVRLSDTIIEPRTRLQVLRSWADPEHPQDRIRAKRDKQVFRRNTSEGPDRFLAVNEITAADL